MNVQFEFHHADTEMAHLPLFLDTEKSDALRFKQLLSILHDSALGIKQYSGCGQTSNIQTFKDAIEQTGNAIASLLATNQQQYEEIERLQVTTKEAEAAELKKKLAQLNKELTTWRRAGTLKCRSEPCQEVFMTYQALKNHEKGAHNIGAERFSCPYCSKTYVKKPSFDEHLRRCRTTATNRVHLNAAQAGTVYTAPSTMASRMNSSDVLSIYHSLTAASLSPDPHSMTPSSQLEFQFQPNGPIRTFSSSQIGPELDNTDAFAQVISMNSAEGYSPGESTHLSHYILSPIGEQQTSSVPMFTDIAWRPDESLDQQYQQSFAPVTAQISTEAPQRVLHLRRPGQITLSRRQSAPACSLLLMPGENTPFRLDGPPHLLPSHLSEAVTSPPPASPNYAGQPQLSLIDEPQMTFQRVGDKRKGMMQIAESNIVRHNTCFTSGPETRSRGGVGGWSSINYANTGYGM